MREKGPANLVTEADFAAQETIVKLIRSRFPDHAFLGEEGLDEPSAGQPYRWVIDPLDGTSNYVHRFPYYAVSIGLEYERQIVLGVIYDPNRDELFFAERGQGADLERAGDSPLARDCPLRTRSSWRACHRPSREIIPPSRGCCACCPTRRLCSAPARPRSTWRTSRVDGSTPSGRAVSSRGMWRRDRCWSAKRADLITRMNGEPFDFLLPDLLATNSPAAWPGAPGTVDSRE